MAGVFEMALHCKRIIHVLTCVLLLGLLVSGCGRRGALEAPPGARVVTTDEQGNTVNKSADQPDKPFILDGLI